MYKKLDDNGFLSIQKGIGNSSIFIPSKAVATANLVDKDGNIYTTVDIGSQRWIVENFKCTKYADGSSIPLVVNQTDWNNDTIGAYCYVNGDISNLTNFGHLYNWYAVTNVAGIAYLEINGVQETGWRVPTLTDTQTLSTYLGGDTISSKHMKSTNLDLWVIPDTNADNSSGLSVGGAGQRNDTKYQGYKIYAGLWTSTQKDATLAYCPVCYIMDANLYGSSTSFKYYGSTIRLVKDI